MIECIFTIDYEIYGNGEGSLKELVFYPAEKLGNIFKKADCRFVAFIEAAELELIETKRTDPAIDDVKNQMQTFYAEGFEIGLHLHPQWYKHCIRMDNGYLMIVSITFVPCRVSA